MRARLGEIRRRPPAGRAVRLQRALVALGLVFALCAPARAGDLADEADLHFELGAERFRAHDYRSALEHFLASNRLVPNRNVVFDIANTYAQLKAFPDAYRYYIQALDGETDPKQRELIGKAIVKVSPLVAVLNVATVPAGATIYVDRTDLGARGASPTVLSFAGGKARILARLDGYEPAESEELALNVGTEGELELRLTRIVGTVRVSGEPHGATVESAGASCALPCELQLGPGRRSLRATAEGFQPGLQEIEVHVNQVTAAEVKLNPVTGALVVDTDVASSAIEVDGKVMGFTPDVVTVPVGKLHVRLTHKGYLPVEREVEVKASEQVRVDAQLVQLDEVSAASRTAESADDAVGSITVLSGAELRALGYATVAEALRGVRGVFLNDDHPYASIGIRGFGPAGSYGNKTLVQYDGHSTNDDYAGESYIGYDGRPDLEDVERIEIVRGPGSVVYGTGAFLGVINIVPKGKDAPRESSGTLATDDSGLFRAHVGVRIPLKGDAGFSASVGGASAGGHDLYFPEYAAAGLPGVDGNSRGADGFRSGNGTVHAWWGDLSLLGSFNARVRDSATGEYATFLSSPDTHFIDKRSFAELRFEPHLSPTLDLLVRASIDHYTYDATLSGAQGSNGIRKERYRGSWAGGELRLTFRPLPSLRLMAGAEGQRHFTAEQHGAAYLDTQPTPYLDQANPFSVGAAYLLADFKPLEAIHLSAGARLDAYSTFGSSVNPRVALIVKPRESTVVKLMGGRAFKAPSVYELYYNDGGLTQDPACNPACALKPETILSGELEVTHHFSPAWTSVASGFVNRISDLIVLNSEASNPFVSQYQNTTVPIQTLGAEVEVRREWRSGWMASVSYSFQHSRFVQDPGPGALRQVPNSPNHLAGARLAVPLAGRALLASTRLSYEGPRSDRFDNPTDQPQGQTGSALLWDLVLSGDLPDWHLRYTLGIYNLADWRYSYPVSTEFSPIHAIQQSGRSLRASTTVTF